MAYSIEPALCMAASISSASPGGQYLRPCAAHIQALFQDLIGRAALRVEQQD
jgi:hypothetical protein